MFSIGARLKTIRETRGMSQKQMAQLLGMSNTRISNWELGVSRPDVDALALICTQLNISADYLLGIIDTPRSPFCANLNDAENALITNFDSLNEEGQDKLIEYGNDLAALPKYKKCDMAAQQEA